MFATEEIGLLFGADKKGRYGYDSIAGVWTLRWKLGKKGSRGEIGGIWSCKEGEKEGIEGNGAGVQVGMGLLGKNHLHGQPL